MSSFVILQKNEHTIRTVCGFIRLKVNLV